MVLKIKFLGPFLIADRPSKSTIQIQTGTHPDGRKRLEVIHWSNARPAFVDPNTPTASRSNLGRPSKQTTGRVEIPSHTEHHQQRSSEFFPPNQTTTNSNAGNFEPSIIDTAEPPDSQPTVVEPEPPLTPQPTSGPPPTPPFTPAMNPDRPVRSTRGQMPAKYKDYQTYYAWSASPQEIASINKSIGG